MANEGKEIARSKILRARLDEKVIMYAVVRGKLGGKTLTVSEAPSVGHGNELLRPESIHGLELRWYKVQPTGQSYDNTKDGFHWDTIDYAEFPMGPWGKDWSIVADAHPITPYADENKGAGTMAFMVKIRMGDRVICSPGKDSLFRGGLSDSVPRVAFRMDDSYIGRLTELFNTPYIWASSGSRPKDHQAERLIGSDCADFIVYGARRLGKKIPYRATWHLPLVTITIARSQAVDKQGRFLDRRAQPLKIGPKNIHIGDLLLFRGHVGALVQDLAPTGILDDKDLMIHTLWAPPRIQPIGDTPYASSKVRVLRWK